MNAFIGFPRRHRLVSAFVFVYTVAALACLDVLARRGDTFTVAVPAAGLFAACWLASIALCSDYLVDLYHLDRQP
jgi:hypothetical protein